MQFDAHGSNPSNYISMQRIDVVGDSTSGYLAVPGELFYEKDFELYEKTGTSSAKKMTLGTDYVFAFVVPGYRTIDNRYAAYAGVELITYDQSAQYFMTARMVGQQCGVGATDIRRFFLDNDDDADDFFGLLAFGGYIPDEERLQDTSVNLIGVLINEKSLIGSQEVAARALSARLAGTTTSTGSTTELVDATSTVKGVMKLTGDLGGTADNPTVPGLSSKITQNAADARYQLKQDAITSVNDHGPGDITLTASDVGAYTKQEINQLLTTLGDRITALDDVVVKSVENQLPDAAGNVVLSTTPFADGGTF